jgi:hypothetical protein
MLTKWQPDTIHSRKIGCMWHSYHLLCSLLLRITTKGTKKNAHNSIESNNCWFTLFTFVEKSDMCTGGTGFLGGGVARPTRLCSSSTYKFLGGLCIFVHVSCQLVQIPRWREAARKGVVPVLSIQPCQQRIQGVFETQERWYILWRTHAS